MNAQNNLISIIIPIYNRENVIEECIHSVQAQSHQNFEIIIVDDGSSDNTYTVCKTLAKNEPRIKLFASEHGGVSAARNMALDNANGEYVFFLDSDDVIHPFLLETLLTEMVRTDALIGGTDVANVSENYWHIVEEKLNGELTAGETEFKTNEEALEAMFVGKSPLRCIGGVMMNKALIGNTQFNTEIFIGEDFLFIYENLIKGADCIFLKQKWYYVRLHKHNSSWNYNFDGFYTRFSRRKLVWISEESLGRTKYANLEKKNAFGCYVGCSNHNPVYSKENRKIRKFIKTYNKQLFPIMEGKHKILYILYVYFPATMRFLQKLRTKISGESKR